MFLQLMFKFLAGLIFSKDEYNIKSKHFNPIRVIVVIALVLNLLVTIYLIRHIVNIHDKLKEVCPQVLELKDK